VTPSTHDLSTPKGRLLELAQLLRRNAYDPMGVVFNLEHWIRVVDRGSVQPSLNCGTQACAIGLACLYPPFQELGLSYSLGLALGTPIYRHEGRVYTKWDAVMRFFKLSYTDATKLFFAWEYSVTSGPSVELEVAKRIQEYVEYSLE